MTDWVWRRGEERPFEVELVREGALVIEFMRGGKLGAIATKELRGYRRGDTPGELDHALLRMDKGDFPAAERLLAPLADGDGWVRAHAGFHRANARRLRAELEGTGHDEALALLDRWRAREGEHFLAPYAATAMAEAALAAGQHQRALSEFERLAGYGLALASRLGVARVRLASREDPSSVLEELARIEAAALDARDVDVAMLARITRASALGKTGRAKEGADLLLELLETKSLVRSCWHGAVLNAIASLIADLAGRLPDGAAKPEARVAASYYINRALRYTQTQPLERAKTLALAVEANTLAGRHDIAIMAKSELGRRYATSRFYAKVR